MAARKVVILGGGIAGLAAAAELRRLRPELELALLEARPRLGGRVWTELDSEGRPLELGAEFVHGRPPALLAALRKARLPLVEEADDFWIAGQRGGGWPDTSAFDDALARTLRPGAADTTVEALLRGRAIPAPARVFARAFTEGYYVAPPARASARAIARMEEASGAIDGERSAQLASGYAGLVRWLGAQLREGDVRRGVAVTGIAWKRGRVRVASRGWTGRALPALEADRAVVALPLPALQRGGVAFRPALPQRDAADALRMGNVIKVQLRLRGGRSAPRPFFCLAPGQPVPTWWRGAPAGSPWVVGWCGGPRADRLDRLSDRGLLRASLASLAVAFGEPVASLEARLEDFRATRWGRDPLFRGAYAWVPLGADGAMEELARPAGETLFFAGEATHPGHAGTVHGAHDSGVRAARELAATLR